MHRWSRLLAFSFGLLCAPAPATAAPPPAQWTPARAEDPEIRALWKLGLDFESERDYLAAAKSFEKIALRLRDRSHVFWRIARDYSILGELTPATDKALRLRYANLTMAWADRGTQVDPSCGECCLYKFAGMGRLASTNGLFASVSWLGELAETLERCLELDPSFVHSDWDHERGNLYYGAATFKRVLPESRWMKMILGVRGDRRRALELSRKAHAIAGMRIDYNVELAASLLCLGYDRDEDEKVAEGIAVLRKISQLEELAPTDPLERISASRLSESPNKACGYTRDGWIDATAEAGRGE